MKEAGLTWIARHPKKNNACHANDHVDVASIDLDGWHAPQTVEDNPKLKLGWK